MALNPQDCRRRRRSPRPDHLSDPRAGRNRLDAARVTFEDELEVWLGAALSPERLGRLTAKATELLRKMELTHKKITRE